MKKRVCIAVILAALLLTGCAGNPALEILEQLSQSNSQDKKDIVLEEDGAQEGQEPSREQQNAGEAHSSKANITAKDSDSKNQKESREVEEAEKQEEDTDSYVKGTLTEEGWESEYWNLRYTVPEGVFMLSEEGLDAVMGISQDKVTENYSDLQKKYLELTTLYEMMSLSATGDVNVVVSAEKLMMKGMTTEDYKNAAGFQLRLLKEPVMEILDDSKTTEIAGETYSILNALAKQGDVQTNQDYYVRVSGNRALCIIITYTDDTADKATEILEGFTVY